MENILGLLSTLAIIGGFTASGFIFLWLFSPYSGRVYKK